MSELSEATSGQILAVITAIGIWVILGLSGAPEWTYIAGFFFAVFVGWLSEN